MKFIFILVTCNLIFYQIIESKPYRVHMEDKILPYIDKSVPSYSDYFSIDNFLLEQIDDDNVQIGGYLEATQSMDRGLPLLVNIRTQYYEKATWNEGTYQITMPNACLEFINPQRSWYNITKLWTPKLCPSQMGDKLEIEPNQINIIVDVPATIPIVPWKAFIMVTQGIFGFEKNKFGFGIQLEFLSIN